MTRRSKGEGSIFQLPDGRWRARLRINGVEHTRERRTRAAAAQALIELRTRAGTGPTRMTVGEHLSIWLGQLDLAQGSRSVYETQVRLRLRPYLGHVTLQKLTPHIIESSYKQMLLDGTGTGAMAITHATLSSALTAAWRWGLIPDIPTRRVEPPDHTAADPKPLTVEQAQRLLETTRGDRLHILWVLLIMLGLRSAEARGVEWRDIDTDGILTIRREITKSKSGVRRLPLPAPVIELLADEPRRGPTIVTGPAGRPVPATTARGDWAKALQNAGCPHVRMHDCRHTTGSLLAAYDVPERVIQAVLGHASPAMSNWYSQQQDPSIRDALAKLSGALAGGAADHLQRSHP